MKFKTGSSHHLTMEDKSAGFSASDVTFMKHLRKSTTHETEKEKITDVLIKSID
jgi:hypothetical protein